MYFVGRGSNLNSVTVKRMYLWSEQGSFVPQLYWEVVDFDSIPYETEEASAGSFFLNQGPLPVSCSYKLDWWMCWLSVVRNSFSISTQRLGRSKCFRLSITPMHPHSWSLTQAVFTLQQAKWPSFAAVRKVHSQILGFWYRRPTRTFLMTRQIEEVGSWYCLIIQSHTLQLWNHEMLERAVC